MMVLQFIVRLFLLCSGGPLHGLPSFFFYIYPCNCGFHCFKCCLFSSLSELFLYLSFLHLLILLCLKYLFLSIYLFLLTPCNVICLVENNTDGENNCFFIAYALICTIDRCAYIHYNVVQHIIYTCLPHGHGLNQYVHTILLLITILKGTHFCEYITTII